MQEEFNPWYYKIKDKLIKKLKPCLVGDYVHLHSRNGCYRVHYVYLGNFVVMKDRKYIDIAWEDYKCHKGEGNSEEAKFKRQAKALLETTKMHTKLLQDLIKRTRK
jgi:hypothetical protein